MYDAHLHLQDSRLVGCRVSVLNAAAAAGVNGVCCCGCSPDDWAAVAEFSALRAAPDVLPAFGAHPWYVNSLPPDWHETLARFLDAHPSAPVGEIGLDGLRADLPRDVQRRIFEAQLREAVCRERPVVLHGARAWGELVACLKPCASRLPGFVVHAFSGSCDILREILALGGCVSFAGAVCNPGAARTHAAAAAAPADRLLVETDAPDIFPPGGVSARVDLPRINQPANLPLVVAAVANLRHVPPAEIAACTEANARRVFGLGPG